MNRDANDCKCRCAVRPPRGIGQPQYDELCEIAVRQGILKFKGVPLLPMRMPNIPDRQITRYLCWWSG